MSDTFWANVRYVLIAVGIAIAVRYWGVSEASASTVVSPIVDIVLGLLIAAGSAAWGNYVKFGTKAVPVKTAERTDVPTVSAVTGKVEPGNAYRG
jgi:hypothetical protein